MKFIQFCQAISLIIKKKYEKGIEFLNETKEKNDLGELLMPIMYNYRAYALLNISKYKVIIQ